MRVRSALLVSLVVALLLSAGPAVVTALDDHDQRDDRRQDIRIELQENGDAIWTVEHHYVLENQTEQDRFKSFAEEVRSGQRDVGTDRSTFAQFLPHAEAQTDREMSIEDAGWEHYEIQSVSAVAAFADASYDEDTRIGTIRYTFTWTNFAETDDGYLHLQDAFTTASGDAWFSGLGPSQRLIIEAPPEHDFVTAPQGIDNNQLVWSGPATLGPTDFEIVLVSRAGVVGFILDSWPLLLGGLSLVAVAGGILWYARTKQDDEWGGDAVPGWWPDGATLPNRLQALVAGSAPGDDAVEADTASPQKRDPTGVAAPDEGKQGVADPELLSDEERVMHLLTDNGGRMKQAAIVNETGWSNAKVSQLLSQMDDEDEIEKLRIGRENLITLPDVDPTQTE